MPDTHTKIVYILLVEDNPGDARLVKETLADADLCQFEIVWVDNLTVALDQISKGDFDTILLDLNLPESRGLDTFTRTYAHARDIPIIVLTGLDDKALGIETVQHGAQDYMIKGDVYTAGITRSILFAIERKRLVAMLNDEKLRIEKAYAELKISQEIIIHQEKLAALGTLVVGVAHEINNSVGIISGNIQVLELYAERLIEFINMEKDVTGALTVEEFIKRPEEGRKRLKIDHILDDTKKMIKSSLEGVDRIVKIVRGLTSFARKDTDEAEPADINGCIRSSLIIIRNRLKYKAVVREVYSSDIPMTRCYQQQISHVFVNLLSNAADAIDKWGEITIKTWHEKDSIYVSVSDTGCGIPMENLNRIFDNFFTTKEVGKGTGLGLSISLEIIKRHKGEISVQSEVGKGTTLTVRLPVVA